MLHLVDVSLTFLSISNCSHLSVLLPPRGNQVICCAVVPSFWIYLSFNPAVVFNRVLFFFFPVNEW